MTRWRRPHQGNRSLATSAGLVNAAAIALLAIGLLSACASPVEGVWPTTQDSATRTVSVSLDTWHAMIAFPVQPAGHDQPSPFSFEEGTSPQHPSLSTQHFYEEWGYAERAWYLEDRRGLSGILRALLWPTEGVVEAGRYDRVWAQRTPQPPSELFVFRVSDEGYQRLRWHLRSTIAGVEPVATVGRSAFYPAVRSYYVFHTCHQYAAHALRAAGLPISAFWAFNRTSLAWQLRRTARIAEQQSMAEALAMNRAND